MYQYGIASSVNLSSGSYSWSIPPGQAAGSDYKIRITCNADKSVYDYSDGNFSIAGPITVKWPAGGEILQSASAYEITWSCAESTCSSDARLSLYKGGDFQYIIASNLDLSAGSYMWRLPAEHSTGSDFKIRITCNSNADIYDYNDEAFSIERKTLFINEIMVSNSTVIADEDGDFGGWIEIHNAGDLSVDLDGYFLSDSESNQQEWQFPKVLLEAGEYLIIWTSGKDRQGQGGELHAGFVLNGSAGTVLLTRTGGVEVVDSIRLIPAPPDVSCGRYQDGRLPWVLFANSTPGGSNSEGSLYYVQLEPPAFSRPGGFYTGDLAVSIETGNPGARVFYTTDGSEPDPLNNASATREYISPLNIVQESIPGGQPVQDITQGVQPALPLSYIRTNPGDIEQSFRWYPPQGEVFKCTVVRAGSFMDGALPSSITTNTYFVHPDGSMKYSLPVISIATNKENLFDYHYGIYVPGQQKLERDRWPTYSWSCGDGNYMLNDDEWEKMGFLDEQPGHMEFYETGGQPGFSQNIGIRIHGGFTCAFPQKSLRIYARSEYDGNNSIDYELFPGLVKAGGGGLLHTFKRIILRNGGSTFYDTMFKEALMQGLIGHVGLDTQAYRPAVVFINGEYWGILNIRERYDDHYLETNYGINRNNIVVLEGNAVIDEGEPGDEEHYKEMLRIIHPGYAEADYPTTPALADSSTYNKMKENMDIDNFINYYAAQIYFANHDWPYHNIKFWRMKTGGQPNNASYGRDGRWRWMLYDTDTGFSNTSANTLEHATSPHMTSYSNPAWSTFLIRSLLENEEFKAQFINTLADHLNTSFETGRVLQKIEEMSAVLEPEMQEHINRWNRYPASSVAGWRNQVQALKVFAQERPVYLRQQIIDYFGLEGSVEVTLSTDSTKGTIRINSVEISGGSPGVQDPSSWTGTYFKKVPIKLTALPRPGYRFASWEGIEGSESENLTIEPAEDISLTAVFVTGEGESKVSIPDEELRKGIEAVLGKQPGEDIYISEMESITVLDLGAKNISDLEGLQHAVNLRELDLRENNITSVSQLGALTRLEILNLRENDLYDISPLCLMINLTYLNIHSNVNVENVGPIGELTSLRELIMRNVPVGDGISAFENLKSLYRVNLRNCNITNVTALGKLMESGALQDNPEAGIVAEVDIRDNPINDYNPVRSYWGNITDRYPVFLPEPPPVTECGIIVNLPNGGESLKAGAVYNITWSCSGECCASGACISLYKEDVYQYPITQSEDLATGTYSWTVPADQSAGSDYKIRITCSVDINIYDYSDSNFTINTGGEESKVTIPDDGLRKGLEAALGKQPGEDIYASEMESITALDLGAKKISDLEGLQYAVNLRELDLRENKVTSVSRLGALTRLETLNLRENDLRDISPLGFLTNLKYLNIHSNVNVENAGPVGELTNLRELIMRNVPVGEGISSFENLKSLYRVNLRNCDITNVTALGKLMQSGALQDNPQTGIVAEVDIRDNPITDYNPVRSYWDNITDRYPLSLPEPPPVAECGIIVNSPQ